MPLTRTAKMYISLGIAVLILIIAVAVIGYGVYQVFYNPASLFERDFSRLGNLEDYFGERVTNVLMLGFSRDNNAAEVDQIYRVDTILVASINFDQRTVQLLSIPRDSYVAIAGTDVRDKLQYAYRYGYQSGGKDPGQEGIKTTLSTVEGLLGGFTLHYYAAINMEGLMQLVDSMGGVEFDVAFMIPGDTPAQDLYAGPQLLDGGGYLRYLTYREPDSNDDLERIERQKRLLLATFRHLKETGRFRYVLPTYKVYRKNVYTNLHFNQVAALVVFASEMLELDAVTDYSLQGKYMNMEGEYYLILDDRANAALVRQFFY